MGCFGGSSDNCSWLWIIILLIIIFCFCGGDNGFFGGCSDLLDNCEWLVVLAVILLIFFLSNDGDHCCD
ncbi:hypothetical protein [Ruminiclostridium papyrosolvens]|uniref:Uncharacterized protein n=1 Tax=Ruminiclostridium papyrosolvens C7 TaxID=1330534 RepID=U4R6R7_9FIRM|nr:hypothetical protein [Ruminiclostridium papyrosolvens]EPR13672.1 hypothetical protein L323_02780 [Ruminiclostridium papyrosolvens C7]